MLSVLSVIRDKFKKYIDLFLDKISPGRQKPGGLLEETEKARKEWQHARQMINYADDDMLDYAIFYLNATERRFMGLLMQAREAGLKAWSEEDLQNPAPARPNSGAGGEIKRALKNFPLLKNFI